MEPVRSIASPEAKRRMAEAIVEAVKQSDRGSMASMDSDGQMVALDCYVDPEELLTRLQMLKPIVIEVQPGSGFLPYTSPIDEEHTVIGGKNAPTVCKCGEPIHSDSAWISD